MSLISEGEGNKLKAT